MSFNQKIEFNIIKSRRKTLVIQVKSNGEVLVKAPIRLSDKKILSFIEKHQGWIIKKKHQIINNPKKVLKYIQGEKHYYLGNPFKLDIQIGFKEFIELSETCLIIFTRNKLNSSQIKVILYDWYRRQAENIFLARFDQCLTIAKTHGIKDRPSMNIKRLKSRWGSCSSNKNISLNLELIKMPIHCLNYIIMHELCHLKHMNHGKRFYALLEKLMPDWKEHKLVLRKRMHEYGAMTF
ncbi:MAG: M48 family metallopeptidase [Gammaproteobacteria bacterium]|nr:M48 family metallopeptidase [Gammaproteobacteria bacterium]